MGGLLNVSSGGGEKREGHGIAKGLSYRHMGGLLNH